MSPCFAVINIGSGNISRSLWSWVAGGMELLEILAARRLARVFRLPQIDPNPAAGIAPGAGFVQHHPGVTEALGDDHPEDVGGHHAHRRAPDHLFRERANAIAKDDLLAVCFNAIKITLNAPLQS